MSSPKRKQPLTDVETRVLRALRSRKGEWMLAGKIGDLKEVMRESWIVTDALKSLQHKLEGTKLLLSFRPRGARRREWSLTEFK